MVCVTLLCSFILENEKIKYLQNPTILIDHDDTSFVSYADTLNSDSLYLLKTREHIPVYYFKTINAQVCFDNQCRLLDIIVYWNITGRYLGFEMPQGEFLSKYDHEPFTPEEYDRLNELLADPTLPLGGIPFKKLVELPDNSDELVDGISGATSEDLAEIVVTGAAYTTYTLWNIVYGSTFDLVAYLTENQLTPDLVELILNSPEISDRFWALDRLDQVATLNPKLIVALLGLISEDNFSLSYSTINAFTPIHLNAESLQVGLFAKYGQVNHSLQKAIIDKLMEAPYLHPEVVSISRDLLDQLNGKQLEDMLHLYSRHAVDDLATCMAVSKILQNDNQFISKQAYRFLQTIEISDKQIISLLDGYKHAE